MSDLTGNEVHSAARLVRGNPSAEELAAALAVLEAQLTEEQAKGFGGERTLKSTWSRNVTQLRSEILPGAGQWRAATRRGLSN
jgi:hypothetical protein